MNKDKHFIKIIILFILILLVIILFLSRVFYLSTHKPPHFISTSTISKDLALRGKIISKDNYILAQDKKIYSVAIIGKYINPTKKELLINLLSIYTNKPTSYFRKKLNTTKRVVILRHISYKIKKNLDYLSNYLMLKKVFLPNNKKIIYGLDIFEELSSRNYLFKDKLQPILGYLRYDKNLHRFVGKMGLERYYDDVLKPKQNGYIKGLRDVKGRIIYDNKAFIKPRKDGDNLYLNINLILQGKIENLLDKQKKELNASQILAVVMESKTGKIIAIASSNRYNPMQIRQKDISNLKMGHIQYTYEPGSVMKPITLAMLLQNKKVNIYEVLNAHNGVFYFKRHFTIYDDEKFKWINVIQAVIHSSNIVFAQLGLRLSSKEFRDGLLNFGFGQKTGIDLPYEYKGIIFSQRDLVSQIHRASNSFGYAMQVNLIQLLQAYNTFNNNGILISPKIAYRYGNNLISTTKRAVISPAIAQTILNILRKVVLEGTAKRANIPGLFIAGKTGTAKISKNGQYIKGLYNSSFIGFANDNTNKYTIATLVIKPDPKNFFASKTAVVVFRNIVNIMIDMGFLKPKINFSY